MSPRGGSVKRTKEPVTQGRRTFRDAAGSVAYQRQLRDRYAAEGVPPGLSPENLKPKKSRVRPVTRQIASKIIMKYEWLGTMSATSYHYGIFFGGFYCAGVCCVGGGNCVGGTNVHSPFGIERSDLLILARGACVHWAPKGTNSRLIAMTCKLLEQEKRGKLLIAYSDLDAGEIGTVYQASNWTYIGAGSSTEQWVAPNGAVHDAKHPANLALRKGGTRAMWVKRLKASGWRTQASNPKHRYVKVIDRKDERLKEVVSRMEKPYPKRARDIG